MERGEQAGAAEEQVWLILQRDLTVWLRGVKGPNFITMVLDLANRGTRSAEAGSTPGESFRNALALAAKKPSREMEPLVPDRIQVPVGLAEVLRRELARLESEAGFRPDTIIQEVTPEAGAEGVLDDLIVQIAGRQPAEEVMQPEDATVLYEHARRFMEAQPWTRWTSEDPLRVELELGAEKLEGVATVVGQGYTHAALLLLPGRKRVSDLMASYQALPVGTIFMQLEGAEIPPDIFLRARRYGWPADAAMTPNFISVRDHGFQEIDRRESWPLAAVLAGVVAHFERGDVGETEGHVDLPTGHRARYRVRTAAESTQRKDSAPDRELLGIKISSDLLPDDSDVQIGFMGMERLAEFRQAAEIRLPPTFPFPEGIKRIPMIAMSPSNQDFTGVADRLMRSKPLGATVIESSSGPMLTIMGERAGFVIADDRPSADVWKRNIQDSDGAHVVIVTDRIINKDEPDPERPGAGELGRVYGLFECLLRGGSSKPIES